MSQRSLPPTYFTAREDTDPSLSSANTTFVVVARYTTLPSGLNATAVELYVPPASKPGYAEKSLFRAFIVDL